MAVVRMTFPDAGAIESAARALEQLPEAERGAREIRRAKERPGRTIELTAGEMILLGSVSDKVFPRIRAEIKQKAQEAEQLLQYDADELARRRGVTRRIRRLVQNDDHAA